MKGIRKKLNVGFLILIALLMFSGMVSMFELGRLSDRTQAILKSSYYNIELSTQMLNAIEQQNSALLQMVLLQQSEYDSSYVAGCREFDKALTEAAGIEQIQTELDSIVVARDRYQSLVRNFFDDRYNTDAEWFLSVYKTTYNSLTSAIKEYMTNSQYSLVSRATQLENNAYRAIMPGIITLVVSIIIVLLFMFLIELYYTRPIIKIQKGLQDYLRHNIPFNVTMEGHDEIYKLKESIEALIMAFKNKKSSQ